MRVSSFAKSDITPNALIVVPPWPVSVAALMYLAAHLLFLAPSLEDIDSINFALALRHFDPASHQPHPPGYPVYVGLGRASLAAVNVVFPSMSATRAEALALSIWSALGGVVAIVAAWFVFRAIGGDGAASESHRRDDSVSVWAVLLLAVAPLFWMTGLRPMSDMPGLGAVLTVQALLLLAIDRRGLLVVAALGVGLAAGLRSQSVPLTAPLFVWALLANRKAGWQTLLMASAAVGIGVVLWAVPLLIAAGGLQGYMQALGSQAGEDFGWVNMLWSNPVPRRLAFALYETFVLPWASVPLAIAVLAAAGVGAVSLLRNVRAFALFAVAFVPYLVFHLLFQETPHVRYALPFIPAIVLLAARGILTLPPRFMRPVGIALVFASAIFAVPAGMAYGSEAHPAFRAMAEMASEGSAQPAMVYSHYSLFRPLQAGAPSGVTVVAPTRSYEWLGLTDYWRNGGEAPVWFLADPRRTDLALIDPQGRHDVKRYRWSVADRPELGGTRPTGVDRYRLSPPGWFVGEGWSLTAETGGVVRATAKGPDHRPIDAYLRRRPEPVSVMIGGRHLGTANDPAADITVALDGVTLDGWTFDHRAQGPNFLRFFAVPGGIPAGSGHYARLTVAARAAPQGQATPEIAIRQFDVQSLDRPMFGFGEGWHEDEYEVSTGLHWRWTSGRSTLRVLSSRSALLVMGGESPLKYFDAPPTVRFKAGDRVLAEFKPEADFEWRVKIPSDALASANGSIVIETDRIYLPGRAEGTADPRQLGLRIFDWHMEPASD